MSLAKLPLRVATVLALRGRTWAGQAVFDSSIVPLEAKVKDTDGHPLLVVYTDDSRSDASGPEQRDLTGLPAAVDLVIHAAVAVGFQGTEAGETISVARTDAGFEAQLDVIEAQVVRALQRGEDPWCELWRAFARARGGVRTRRGASARKGTRFAAREIILPVSVVADPLGTGPEYPWSLAIDQFAAYPDTSDIAAVLQGFVAADDAPEWLRDYRTLGMDAATARSLAFAAADGEILTWI